MERYEDMKVERVDNADVEVGKSYPLYGTITKFLDDRPGTVLVEISHSLIAWVHINDLAGIERLKARAFEPVIVVGKVVSKNPQIIMNCKTLVFGKSLEYSA